ncbi:hypothetical protein [Paraburkholderia agricolaris]|uniref:hypothetical protein n=1 Tax=Paraburkholderia agricolaris TaxID=2152888 RepID=UPI001290AF49|nr:hypothetical protein [Paraburkholderia agricolaris]
MSNVTSPNNFWRKLIGFMRPKAAAAKAGIERNPVATVPETGARQIIPIAAADAPAVSGFACPPSCWGTCCDDAVFLEARDVAAIHQFADRHFDRFANHFAMRFVLAGVDEEKLVVTPALVTCDGVSRFHFFRNAATSEFLGKKPQSTRWSVATGQPLYHTTLQFDRQAEEVGGCVFLTERRTCFLEEVAVDASEHRWTAKPQGCVLFPLVPMSDGTVKTLASPENEQPDAPNHGLLKKFRERACCTRVTPQNAAHEMSAALAFVEQSQKLRERAFEHLLRTKAVQIRSGFLQIFDRPATGSSGAGRQ